MRAALVILVFAAVVLLAFFPWSDHAIAAMAVAAATASMAAARATPDFRLRVLV